MTKIDIFSGFLGAGKTTLIKKLIAEAYTGEKLVLIENEFGEIGIDGGFLKEAGIEITEMNSGCICCSLVGDFRGALARVIAQYAPDRILIEPSGVGKLSDVVRAVEDVAKEMPGVRLGSFITVADAGKVKMYSQNFGEFYNDQIEHAGAIVLSRTQGMAPQKLDAALELLRRRNAEASFITTPWQQLEGKQILAAMENRQDFAAEVLAEAAVCPECGHSHEGERCDHSHHHEHEACDCGHEACGCGHDHGGGRHEHGHDHEACGCGHDHGGRHHEHGHDHEACGCGHNHDHGHHHHADEVFSSFGRETARLFTQHEVEHALQELDGGVYGQVLRAKGILPGQNGAWIHFDYVPGESSVRAGGADVTGRLCVIGAKLDEQALAVLFHLD